MATDLAMVRERLLELVDEVLAHYRPLDATTIATLDPNRLAELIEALDRLDAGTYGACTSCGAQLGPETLLEKPTAAMCDNCALEDSWRPFGPR